MSGAVARVLPIPQPPPDRGRWLTADQVRAMLGNQVSRKWVYAHIPGKVALSRRVVGWWQRELEAWLEEHRVA